MNHLINRKIKVLSYRYHHILGICNNAQSKKFSFNNFFKINLLVIIIMLYYNLIILDYGLF